MSKVLKPIATVATVVAGVALIGSGIGAALGSTMMFTALGASIAAGTIATVAGVVSAAASIGVSLLTKKPSISTNATDRLVSTLNPNAPRKIMFGDTAMMTHISYEPSHS